MLVNKCRIYDEDIRARSAHYKSINEKKGKDQNRGKPYSTLAEKGKHKASGEKRPSGRESSAFIKCYKCGVMDIVQTTIRVMRRNATNVKR